MNTIVYNPRQLTTFELSSSSRLLLQAVHKTEYRLSHATLNTTHRTFCLFIYFFFHIRNSHSCCVFFSNEFCLLVLCVRACNMEVFQTENFYIFVKKEKSLWWNRTTSEFAIKSGWDLSSVGDIECIGVTPGILGVISLPGVYDPHLVIVREATDIGILYPPHTVHKVKSICMLSDDEPDVALVPCHRHSTSRLVTQSPSSKSRLFEGSQLMNKTWGAVKIAGSTIKSTTQQAAALATNQIRPKNASKDPTKIEKRISDELHKIFDDSDSFYYCLDGDITNNLQRKNDGQTDDRFFWNKHMISDMLALQDGGWCLPIIQGFIQMEQCVIGNDCFTLALVSRRSRYRAGTRYKRRGIDEDGNVANYVETEQILSFGDYQMAFTIVRGSVPVYWSQPGYKYRPPPKLDRDEADSQIAFERHFDVELKLHKSICIINLVEQSGKEKIIFDAYGNHVVKYNNDRLIYVTFDFHDYCRGMHFENVSALIDALAPEASAMGFHWRDKKGAICDQNGVFRVNCMDCLDRTNVVQTALGRAVLESQLVKVGLMPPYTPVPNQLKTPFMALWANNGDVISRQYAGTNALKGDYTRTGERKLAGLVKDGMNSANRYVIQHFQDTFRQCIIDLMHGNLYNYNELQDDDVLKTIVSIAESNVDVPSGYYEYGALNAELRLAEALISSTSYYLSRFKDTYRQATIDLMLGNPVSTESLTAFGGQAAVDENDALEAAEHARQLVEDCRRMLLGSSQLPIGAWGLIDADPTTSDPNETEVDTILLLTTEFYLVAEYDSHLDKIVRFEKIPLQNITEIEFGTYQQTKIFQGTVSPHLCLRISYSVDDLDGYFHMLRSPNIRFFNNVAVVIKTHEEVVESLTAIVEFFRIALDSCGNSNLPFTLGGVLQRRKSRLQALDVPKGMPRNLSETHLVQMGSKAFSNVAGQFSKLSQSLHPKIRTGKKIDGDVGDSATGQQEHASSDSDENESSIYEPDTRDLVEENPIYTENAFLPSVGIVMAASSNELVNAKENPPKLTEDVSRISISSVTENVNMPSSMLSSLNVADRSASPAPAIHVQEIDEGGNLAKSSGQTFCQSAFEVNTSSSSADRNLPLNIPNSQSENALKQLKTLTSPLSIFAKGMQNIGLNLDPRKYGSKSNVTSPVEEAAEPESQKLQEKWEATQCKTKLIAL